MLQAFLAISFLIIVPMGFAYYHKKRVSNGSENTEIEEYDEDSFYFIKHSCGKKTPVSKRFVIGNSFSCVHCQKKVTPKQLRCMRCTALIDLKSITPLFHSPIRCKACKLCFELPTKNANVL